MNTVEKILTAKGYDNDQVNDIVYYAPNLDEKVREEFKVDEPIHLWEAYYRGEADEDVLNETAKLNGFEGYEELLSAMDRKLIQLADEYPANN